jgi:undecaprenyl-diphosphatase
MEEVHAATATSRRPLRRRYPWLVPGGLLLILTLLTINVLTDGPLIAADRWIRKVVQAQATSATWKWLGDADYSPAMLLVRIGGFHIAISVLVLAAVVVAARRRTLRPLFTAGVGVTLLLGIVIPAKILIGRVHPGHGSLAPGSLGAFPSGHTTTACVCYVLAVLLLVPDPPARIRRVALAAVSLLGFLVGAALVWCDFHWFTDVVAGWALAALIVQLTVRLTRKKASPDGSRLEQPAESRASPVAR